MVGSKVQHYQFLEKLGAGGMGEIYRAQDTRLNRFVAIKVLSSSSTGDPDRRRRFIQEAQAASALNHPNIITIHDILTDSDAQFMVMEHVQGKTLSDLIPKGGLRVPQVLKLAMQMTDALQTAHAAGIVHRDLKPGNVMVTDTGLVKILDFGLAKLTDPNPVTQDDATRTIAEGPLTVEGSIIGTVSYMSPEQAQGMKIDTRSDIFSLGVVLYEMITGMRAFHGETSVATLTAILRDDPKPILEVAPDVPPRLAQMVDRCLQKSPDDRFQTMRDVHLALGGLKHESDSGVLYRSMVATPAEMRSPASKSKPPAAATNSSSSNSKGLIIAAGAVVVIGIAAFLWMKKDAPVAEPAKQVEVTPVPVVPPPPPDTTLTNEQVIQMVAAKVPMDVILSSLRNAPTKFDLSADAVIRLSQAGVPSSLIEAMRDPKNIPVTIPAKTVATAKAITPGAPTSAPAPPKGQEKAAVPTPQESTPTPTPPPVRPANPVSTPVASTPPPVQAPTPVATHQVVLPDGRPFAIVLSVDIPDNAKSGMPLQFTVREDVTAGDSVVIVKGATATGEISQGKRAFGKMMMRLKTVTAADGKAYNIRATGGKNERQVETTVKPQSPSLAASVGMQYIAYVDGEMKVTMKGK